jgi:hypothetical protein
LSVSNVPTEGTPEGARAAGRGYWFAPVPVYLLDAAYDPGSPVNAPAVILWAHVHRHYAWRERVFPSYARLAEETRQSESAVKRQLNVLKAAGAITWGATYRARGRSSNEYALAPMEPFRFDRETAPPVQVKNEPHCPVEVKSEPSVQVKNAPHPRVKNDPGVESSSYLENTDELLSPPTLPAQRPEPDPVHEREMLSPFEDHQQSEPLPGVDTYTAQLADADPTARVTASWVEAYKRSSGGSEPSAKAVSRVRASVGSRLRAGKTADDLALIAIDMAETNLTWTDLAEHEAHWLHKQQQDSLKGTDATVAGWLSLADQLGGRQQHQPYRDDPWHHIKQQAAAGDRPDGWERVSHCGHLDCDEITRMREVDIGDGLKSLTYCSGCHPALQF